MKKIIVLALILSAGFVANAQNGKKPMNKPVVKGKSVLKKPVVRPAGTVVVNTESDSLSYAIGVNIAQSMAAQGMNDLNTNMIATAMNDVFKNKTLALNADVCMPLIMNTMKKRNESKFIVEKTAGETFLAANAKLEGVTTLPSGLQYKVLVAGTGEKPTAADRVKVHYKGTLTDGTVFDSSYDRNEPAVFGVTQVIQGWVEALQLMPVGSKWQLAIPQNLAYGERGGGEKIKPYAALLFDVELIAIEK